MRRHSLSIDRLAARNGQTSSGFSRSAHSRCDWFRRSLYCAGVVSPGRTPSIATTEAVRRPPCCPNYLVLQALYTEVPLCYAASIKTSSSSPLPDQGSGFLPIFSNSLCWPIAGLPWALPRASHPTVTRDARRGRRQGWTLPWICGSANRASLLCATSSRTKEAPHSRKAPHCSTAAPGCQQRGCQEIGCQELW